MSIFISIVLVLSMLPMLLFSVMGALAVYNEAQDGGVASSTIGLMLAGFIMLGLQITMIVLWFIFYF